MQKAQSSPSLETQVRLELSDGAGGLSAPSCLVLLAGPSLRALSL